MELLTIFWKFYIFDDSYINNNNNKIIKYLMNYE